MHLDDEKQTNSCYQCAGGPTLMGLQPGLLNNCLLGAFFKLVNGNGDGVASNGTDWSSASGFCGDSKH